MKECISANDLIFEANATMKSEAFGSLNAEEIDMGIRETLLLILAFNI